MSLVSHSNTSLGKTRTCAEFLVTEIFSVLLSTLEFPQKQRLNCVAVH